MIQKRLFLIIFTAILCTLKALAAFTPGTYYLQTASGTYIEALAVNSSDPGAMFQSTSATAFTFTAVSGGYTIQNASNNNYLLYSTDKNWDTKMSASASETNYAGVWTINEDANGKISISRQYSSTTYYLGNGNTNAGLKVYSGQTSAVWYTLVTENPFAPSSVSFDPAKFYIIKHKASGLYVNTNAKNAENTSNNSTVTKLSADRMMATAFTITANGSGFNLKEINNGKYVGVKSNGWDANYFDAAANAVVYIEQVSDYYIIKKSSAATGSIFLNCSNAQDGSKLYFNVGSSAAWVIEEAPTFTRTFSNYQLKLVSDSKELYMKENAAGNSASMGAIFSADGSVFTTTVTANKATIYDTTTGKYFAYNSSKANWGTLMQDAAYQWDSFVSGGQICFSHDGSYYVGNGSANQVESNGIFAGETSRVWWEFVEAQPYTINVVGGVSGGVIYNGEEYTTTFTAVSGLTTGVLTAIPVSGYQANITMSGTTITVTYTANQVAGNPQAICDLLNRIGGAGTSDKFVTRLDESLFANGKDKFIIGNSNGKPYIQGSSMTAIATGINWYLNHDAHINISWNQLTADIAGASLPSATAVEKTCDADYRYYLNYCTFGYSMTTWTWDRWQKEIDWMALHGINMPLQIIGMEKVWKDFLMQDYGYSEDDAENFVAGPAFIAWWGMNNLEGWGGTHDDAWYTRQADLAQKICNRERELGMQPVLPGFSGMVPSNFQTKTGHAIKTANKWCQFQRPAILDPTGNEFATAAQKYYARLHDVMGDSKYYSMDPFHEGGTISSGKYAEGYKAVYDAMNSNCGSDTKWVIQQWQWAGYQTNCLTAVPAGRLIVLDLFSDGKPAFNSYNGYAPQDAVFCAIPNFGGRSGFMGRLDNMSSNYFSFKSKYNNIKGIGAAPEAIESVPVVYDLLFELPWMGTAPNVTNWVADYATNRYGTANTNAQKAWESIHQSAMAFGADAIQGPIEDVWASRPNLDANKASSWGVTINNAASTYTPERRQKLISAIYDLVGESASLSGSNYQYDIIEAGSQVMADYAYDLLLGIKVAKTAGNTTLFNQRKEAFLSLILGMDAFKGTHQMFRLGNWTQTARDAAAEVQGATTATPDWYELDNARTIITTWGDQQQSEAGGLRDYSYRSWQGLLKDYYYPRWEYYFNNNCTAPSAGWFYSEWNWAHELEGEWGASAKGTQMKAERTYYTPTPEGNTVEEANKLLAKYILPIQLNDKSVKYVYRALETDLTSSVTIEAEQCALVEMPIIGETNIDGTTVTAQLKIDGTLCEGLIIPSITEVGSHTAEYIVSDGTVIKFTLNVKKMSDDAYFYKGEGSVHVFNIRDISAWSALKKQYPWTITMEVETDGLKDFNQWGSVAIADGSQAVSGKQFQIYMAENGDLKIALGDEVVTGISCKKNFMFTLKYNGTQLFLYAKGKDAQGNDKEYGANNTASFTCSISDFTQLSCALPEGVNIKTLNITSEETLQYATDPKDLATGANYVTGNGEVQLLKAQYYITNTDTEGKTKYNYVPQGKAWQMTMDVTHNNNQTASYNQWGSCILSSSSDPINTYYWNNFQVYEHSGSEGSKRGTLNFKSNKGDGNDHVIAQGHKVYQDDTNGYEDYRVIVRYDGGNVYLIRTIILDNNGKTKTDSEGKEMIFNNVWFAARVQHDIDVMSCALPTGTNLKHLAISIAEDSNLLEDVDYAIQNITTKDYLLGTQHTLDAWYGPNAGDAAHYQIEWTNNNDLVYTDTDGGLHHSFYIRLVDSDGNTKYLGANNENVASKAEAVAYIYSENSKKVQPISAKNNVGDSWTIDGADTWLWDFFANFYVEVAGNNTGGLNYLKGGQKQTATNGTYIELPSGVDVARLSNMSCLGYSAAISKADIRLKVQYTPLENTFYNITAKTDGAQPTLYYWYKDRQEGGATLVTYNTGTVAEWGDKGDCSKFTIAKATSIPVKLNQNTAGTDPDRKYYGTIYCPNALVLPEGMTAYAAKDNGTTMRMIKIAEGGEILPAKTAAILQCDYYSAPKDFTLDTNDKSTLDSKITNNLDGTFINFTNPKDGTYYTLSGKNGIGFYRYTGANLNAFKAFCHSDSSTARMTFMFDDTTDIDNLQTEVEKEDAVIYDLLGRRLTSTTKGIYIINGKKVLK